MRRRIAIAGSVACSAGLLWVTGCGSSGGGNNNEPEDGSTTDGTATSSSGGSSGSSSGGSSGASSGSQDGSTDSTVGSNDGGTDATTQGSEGGASEAGSEGGTSGSDAGTDASDSGASVLASNSLVISSTTYSNTQGAVASLVVGTALPNTDTATTPAIAGNDYVNVWNNATVDGSFGITSPITLTDINPANGQVLSTISVPQVVTSFSSKSELGLHYVTDSSSAPHIVFGGYAGAGVGAAVVVGAGAGAGAGAAAATVGVCSWVGAAGACAGGLSA